MRLPLLAVLLCVVALPGSALAQGWSQPQQQEPEKDSIEEGMSGDDLQARIDAIDAERKVERSLEENKLRTRVSRYMDRAYDLINEDRSEEAVALLHELDVNRLNQHERALVYRFMGFAAYTAGDAEGAIESFRKAMAEKMLPVKDESVLRFNIGQLYASMQNWPETISALQEWLTWEVDPDPLGYYLLAVAYFQQEDLDKAIEYAELAIDLSPEPKEGWLQLLAALFVQKEDYASAAPVLEELVLRFPKRLYWVQLSLIYGAKEEYKRSLAVQQVAYAQGLLTEDSEIRRLARSYLYADLPLYAAKVLAKGMEDGVVDGDQEAYELLANSWIAAREFDRSLPPLRRAAELSEDGNLYVRLGQVYLQREDWAAAAESLERGVAKGGLRNPGSALLLLGISNYNNDRVETARSFFQRARQHEETRPQAESWLKHIDNESQQVGYDPRSGGALAA